MKGRVIAVGDVHGCFDALHNLLQDKLKITKQDRIILLGDYIDRGTQSKKVIDYLIYLQSDDYTIIPLLGNHEDMLLKSLGDKKYEYLRLINGGDTTLHSFNIKKESELPNKYINFFKSLKTHYSINSFLFVHAGFNDAIDDPLSDKDQMLWTRQQTFSHPFFNGKTIIHGHTPISKDECMEMTSLNHRVINIDTGCVYKNNVGQGVLTAISLPERHLYFSE